VNKLLYGSVADTIVKYFSMINKAVCRSNQFFIAVFVTFTASLFFTTSINSQDVYKEVRSGWLQKAEQTRPKLFETIRQPVSLVILVKDEKVFQHWKVIKSDPVNSLCSKSFKNNQVL
jgi:uncharacterized oligopeptide transporter (OPT) family protein